MKAEQYREAIQHYVAEFKAQQKTPDPLAVERQLALDYFCRQGFPDKRQEPWHYTDITELAKTKFAIPTTSSVDIAVLDQIAPIHIDSHELVFIDGVYSAALSKLADIPANSIVTDLKTLLQKSPAKVKKHFAAPNSTKVFDAFNIAFMQHGGWISLADNLTLEKPIHLRFIATKNSYKQAFNLRNMIMLGENTEATILQTYHHLDDCVYFTNTVTEAYLGINSKLKHYNIQEESKDAYHIAHIKIHQAAHSYFDSWSIAMGGAISYHHLHGLLQADSAAVNLHGLYIARGQQHVDQHTHIEHEAMHTESHQDYRGLIYDQGHGVFDGKIIVHKDAQKTVATQSNKNLLFSSRAEVDSKPELRIYADDVKCSHGAVVGQLDEAALFYLRSRGIAEQNARLLLSMAFAEEIIQALEHQDIKNYINNKLMHYLSKLNSLIDATQYA